MLLNLAPRRVGPDLIHENIQLYPTDSGGYTMRVNTIRSGKARKHNTVEVCLSFEDASRLIIALAGDSPS